MNAVLWVGVVAVVLAWPVCEIDAFGGALVVPYSVMRWRQCLLPWCL